MQTRSPLPSPRPHWKHRLGWALAVLLLVLGFVVRFMFSAAAPSAEEAESKAIAPRAERPLPRLSGRSLDGGQASTELFRRRRGIVYVFASSDSDAEPVAGIVQRLRASGADANIAFLGLNRDLDPTRSRAFVESHGFDFPILLDHDLALSRKLQVPPGKSTLIVVDAEGYIIGGFAGLEGDLPEIEAAYESEMRRVLHLKKVGGEVTPALGVLPEAPGFDVKNLNGGRTTLSQLEGKVIILVFFAPTCPHCHASLKFLDRLAQRLQHADLRIVPVSVSNRKYVVEDMAEKLEIQLAMYVDPDNSAQRAYAHRHSVPDIIVIDREGRVALRLSGSDARSEAMITMEVRQALGIENPLLLDRKGYSGEGVCQTCHRNQHQTWALTNHAYAFGTLIEHGEERNPECLPCHTVGWEKPGGYSLETPYSYLQGVQCENCHGRGGPHQSPDAPAQGFESVCGTCHNPKHSLNFKFAERLPEISHSMNLRFASLSLEERQALLERRDKRDRTLFEEGAYVGSAACQSCHSAEHELWAKSAHANAFDTLSAKQANEKADCQKCHTTGFNEPGGFPEGGVSLRNVGCESCHGPGENHIKQDTQKSGSILALADKCDSCVILQICGSCHDDQNDPGFEFELIDKLERIRHGSRDTASVGP